MAGASAQARTEMPASAPRGCWDLAEVPGVLAEVPGVLGGADAGVPAHSSRASVQHPCWSGPSWHLASPAGSLWLVWAFRGGAAVSLSPGPVGGAERGFRQISGHV